MNSTHNQPGKIDHGAQPLENGHAAFGSGRAVSVATALGCRTPEWVSGDAAAEVDGEGDQRRGHARGRDGGGG
ncbi:hypothetical protein GCM10010109_52090 [Actinoplanes campanulatus]|nr:hypothetical protein GCM10010109_52090 [Actinoplanes campanulatus]GID41359.1 hypothetical protein Aca09nite_78650 [Actinoplanes campanulatus]